MTNTSLTSCERLGVSQRDNQRKWIYALIFVTDGRGDPLQPTHRHRHYLEEVDKPLGKEHDKTVTQTLV